MQSNNKIQLVVDGHHYNNYQYEVYCLLNGEPVDRTIQEADLHAWLKAEQYCKRGYMSQSGEWVEMPVDVYTFLEDADMDLVLQDYLNHQEHRTQRLPTKPKELPTGSLLPNLAGIGFMSTINRPQSNAA